MSSDNFQKLYTQCLIFDFGSGVTKAGFSTDKLPTLTLESSLGLEILADNSQPGKRVIGRNPSDFGKYIYNPIVRRGIIPNYGHFETFVSKLIPELRANSLENTPILISTPVNSSVYQKSQIAEIFFEKLGATSISFQDTAVLNLTAIGATTGCVLDLGHGLTQVGCLIDQYKISDSYLKSTFGGLDIENILELLIRKRGIYFKPENEKLCIKNIKESSLKIFDFDKKDPALWGQPETPADQIPVILPDGEEVILGHEQSIACELLFNSDKFGLCGYPVHELIRRSIDACPYEHKKRLYKNIYVSGGTSSISGFENRLFQELQNSLPKGVGFTIHLDADISKHQAFVGGTVLTSMGQFANMCISKKQFQEQGKTIIQKLT